MFEGLNPYQTLMKNGEVVRKGDMDTPAKFAQLTQGLDLKGKKVLDVGCNLGTMCRLATEQGAETLGIDINRDFIKQAKYLFSELNFRCHEAHEVYNNYDIIIASAMLHYITDLDKLFKQFSRCTKMVVCDIWLHESQVPIFALTGRGLYIPSRSAFLGIVSKYFTKVEEKGPALSPDQSKRYIFHLSDPVPNPAEAVLIYGEGATGKTILSRTYFGYIFIMTDNISTSWYRHTRNNMYSVKWTADSARGNNLSDYLNFFISTLESWLWDCVNRDIIIEGYELIYEDFREKVITLLNNKGWRVAQIHLTERYQKDYS